MRLQKIALENWRNFRSVVFELGDRLFVVGANASGKSNLLDALRFMRDVVKHGGGLQYAVSLRGGVSKIRCLSARKKPYIGIELQFVDDEKNIWTYMLKIIQQTRGNRNTIIHQERMEKNGVEIFNRPDDEDEKDEERLTQTHIEQITMNKEYRGIVSFLVSIQYMHLVPQLLKFPEAFSGPDLPEDHFGKGFLRTISKTSPETRKSRLAKIQNILQSAVPQLDALQFVEDAGQPHLEVTYKHWRPNAGKQIETDLSDGTLRLIGLLWSLINGQGLLLLEEPELSLHTAIVEKLPDLFYLSSKKRQILMTTHSAELLSDRSISLSQILLLQTDAEGTTATLASSKDQIKALLEGGLTPAEVVLPFTRPNITQEAADVLGNSFAPSLKSPYRWSDWGGKRGQL
ncbi:MAG: AAA family ATPase [Spirochaetaceae bacterium]|jgi:predicted ATPase|nr:AAA family ATPase [Spirochaetaceae bacterium]